MSQIVNGVMQDEGNITNSSTHDGQCFVLDPTSIKVIRSCAYCAVILVSLVGNSLIIAVTCKNKTLRRKTIDYFIVNMAVADISLTLYMPRMISLAYAGYEWQVQGLTGEIFCRISTLLSQTCMAVSIFTVVAISFDRFFAVLFPLTLPLYTPGRAKWLIVLIWSIAAVVRFPMVYSVTVTDVAGKPYCFILLDENFGPGTEKIYYLFNLICLFAVPFLVILILYSAIVVTLKRRKPPRPDISRNSWQRRKEQTTRKVLRMVTAVVVAFVLCWLLYFIRLILYSYGLDVSCNLLFLRLFLAHLNSGLNPCLYVAFSENYRQGVKKLFKSLCCFQVCNTTYTFAPVTTAGKTKTNFNENMIHGNEKSDERGNLSTKL